MGCWVFTSSYYPTFTQSSYGPKGSMNTGRPTIATPSADNSQFDHPEYAAAIAYLYNRINFEKSQDQPYNQQNFRLSRMERLLVQLGNPQQSAPVIHIAGSKGKGSVAWLTAEVLRRSGYRTGLYTSPHLIKLEERFVIDGQPIAQKDLVRAVHAIAPAVDEIATLGHGQSTFFEITTAIAWWLFRDADCDAMVIEVGLGGRLDSTNVCWPTLSIITSISYDHQQQLGNTLAEIASEKAGIIKPGVPVICGVTHEEPQTVIHRIAKERGCQIRQINRDFSCVKSSEQDSTLPSVDLNSQSQRFHERLLEYQSFHNRESHESNRHRFRLRMLGEHQVANSGLVLATVDLLREQGWKIPKLAVQQALAETQLTGRIQIVNDSPLIILDTAHNEASIAALSKSLKEHFGDRKIRFVFAASKDKKYSQMLSQLMDGATEIHLTQFEKNPRAVPYQELASIAASIQQERNVTPSKNDSFCSFHGYASPDKAVHAALKNLPDDELVCITGSFFLAAELIPILPTLFQ
jgi:dihydrofolate synthase / folylpolyglutamate synthase